VGETVSLARDGAVAIITVDKPATLNAFDLEMAEALAARAAEAASDPSARAILLRGGGKHFCAGGDLAAISGAKDPGGYVLKLARTANDALRALRAAEKPVLAELKGAVAGGGVGLALAADLRIAADSTKISLAFLKVGLVPDMGSTWSLPRLVGRGRTFELAAEHGPLPVLEAWRMGLVNRVVKADEIDRAGVAWAKELAQLPPKAVGELKRLLGAAEADSFEAHILADSEAIARMAGTQDFLEGARAFFEKRPASFEGR
jgi:2-(1,2-epoxy-1,2-dihydrophenyl)acetyl-CoA isomerase